MQGSKLLCCKIILKCLFGNSYSPQNWCSKIQADRYEVFVEARSKPCTAFDYLSKKVPVSKRVPKMKQILLQYAKDQAIKDPRLNGKTEYIFGNFSLLITYGRCKGQEPHIDLLLPNWQFGLVLTDNAPATCFTQSCAYVQTVKDVQARHSCTIPIGDTKPLWEVIRGNTHACELIQKYGELEVLKWTNVLQCYNWTWNLNSSAVISRKLYLIRGLKKWNSPFHLNRGCVSEWCPIKRTPTRASWYHFIFAWQVCEQTEA